MVKQPKFSEMLFPSVPSDTIVSEEYITVNQQDPIVCTEQCIQIMMDEGCDDLIPTKAHSDDAGYDLKSKEDVLLQPHNTTLVHTGVHICMHPEIKRAPGYVIVTRNMLADVRSRSGLALKHGLLVLNSPGTIDQSYKGEICVIMFNTKNNPYRIKRGDRIAQLVFLYQPITHLTCVDKATFEALNTDSDRGSDGFGSTGK